MITLPRAVVWACAIFVAVAFVFAGFLKLQGPSAIQWGERFVHWGYPANAHYVVGVLEILGGLGVLIPKWRRAAAATLIVIMIGAIAMVHGPKGFFQQDGGFEYNVALIGLLLPILLCGAGRFAIGRLFLPRSARTGRTIVVLE